MNDFYTYIKIIVLSFAFLTGFTMILKPEWVGEYSARMDNSYDKFRAYTVPLCEGKM